MKKLIIGALVGGILMFIWQSASWTFLGLHEAEYKKAPNQDEIVSYLSNNLTEDGQYFLPRADEAATAAEREKMQEDMQGKPWAVINYHKAYDGNMVSNIIRGLLVTILAAFFICWILMKNTNSTFGSTFVSCLLIGVTSYLFFPYIGHIWFQSPGATMHLLDALVAWGLCGVWLGWWLNRK